MAALQKTLRALGYAEVARDPPGSFGLWTEAAVQAVQRGAGLVGDGLVGPHTEEALGRAAPTDPAVSLAALATLATLIDVPYCSQRDNAHNPNSSCNVTALAMALLWRGVRPQRGQLEDELFELLRSPEADAHYREQNPALHARGVPANEVHDNLVWAAGRYGVAASFSGQRTLDEITAEIAAGRPVLLSGVFVGSGHIVLLIGLTAAGDFICHDPFGDWSSDYQSRDGAARIYPRERALAVLKDLGAPNKWGLFLRP